VIFHTKSETYRPNVCIHYVGNHRSFQSSLSANHADKQVKSHFPAKEQHANVHLK